MDLERLKEIDLLQEKLHLINDKLKKTYNKRGNVDLVDYITKENLQETLDKKISSYNRCIGDYRTHKVIYNEFKFIKIKLLGSSIAIFIMAAMIAYKLF